MPTIIKNITHIYRNLTLVLLVSIMALTAAACGGDGGTSPPDGGDPPKAVVSATEIARSTPTYRHHYIALSIKSKSGTSEARRKLVLKKSSEPAPTGQEMKDGAGVYRIITGTEKKVILAYDINSGIGAYYDGIVAKDTAITAVHNSTTNVDQYLLAPGTKYTLYEQKAGTTNTFNVGTFSTDAFDATDNFVLPTTSSINDNDFLHSFETTPYLYDLDDDAVIIPVAYLIGTDDLISIFVSFNTINVANMVDRVTIQQNNPKPSLITQYAGMLIPSHYANTAKTGTSFDMGGVNRFGSYMLLGSVQNLGNWKLQVAISGLATYSIFHTFQIDK